MPTAVSLPPPDRTAWMNPQACNGPSWPVSSVPDDLVMHAPQSTTVKADTQSRPRSLIDHSREVSPSKLRRRASQGSLRTRPSPVSRFLSKGSVAVNFPSWEHRASPGSPLRVESRNRSADSRLRLSTTVSRGPRPSTAHSSSSWNSPASFPADYPTTLPPTPPDDDSPVAWNPKSGMLLFDAQPHHDPGSMPMMDEGPSVENSSATGASDSLSPSDGLSHGSSSSGSPGPHDEMDCQQDSGSSLDHGINVTGKLFSWFPQVFDIA